MNDLGPALLHEINSPKDLRSYGLWQWLDFTDASTMFVEEDFTTPVAANLDEVGAVIDKSGKERHLTQGTSTARGLYLTNQINGLSAVGLGSAGAGAVDDYWDISNPAILNANWKLVVASVVNTAAVKAIYGSGNNGWREFWDGSEVLTGGETGVANVFAASVGHTAATWIATLSAYSGHGRAIVEIAGVDRAPTGSGHAVVTDQLMTANTTLFGALTGPASFGDHIIAEIITCANMNASYQQVKGFARRYVRSKYGLAV